MKAMIGGTVFWAVGLVRYTERDDDSVSLWEEWVLVADDGDERWLEYDEGKWTLYEKIAPLSAAQTDSGRYGAFNAETGTSTVESVSGEIPYPVAPGDRVGYAERSRASDGCTYSVETDLGSGVSEWFRGRHLDDRAVFTLFDLRHLLAAEDQREQALRDRRIFGLLLLVLSLVSMVFCAAGQSAGHIVAKDTVMASQIGEGGLRQGPYPLNSAGRVHRLSVSTSLASTSMWVQAVVENEEAGALFDTEGEFWDESGSDSEGPWHEYSLESRQEFRLERAGNIYVRLFADPEASAANSPVSFKVEENVLYPIPPLILGIVLLPVGLVFLVRSSPTIAARAWEGMTSRK
ncbi:MAG: DUF4178 domain-containing protein [Cytophagales bacterium]|nr:DUF4178 domain-containing protein [Armatimonadota bacterium]